MGQIDASQKKDAGKILNELKEELTKIVDSASSTTQEKIKFQDFLLNLFQSGQDIVQNED